MSEIYKKIKTFKALLSWISAFLFHGGTPQYKSLFQGFLIKYLAQNPTFWTFAFCFDYGRSIAQCQHKTIRFY
jgi:hypothetical protein